MEASGYGADLSFDGAMVTIRAGKVAARLQHTDVVRFPVSAVEGVQYKAASPLTNGSVQFRLRDQSAETLQSYGEDQPNTVNPQSLVVHFRRKDRAAFEAIRDAIVAAVV